MPVVFAIAAAACSLERVWPSVESGRHEEPQVVAVHRTDHRHALAAHLPVHDRGTVPVRRGQARRAEHDVVVARQPVAALELRADQVAHGAARAVGADQVARVDPAPLTGGALEHGGDALRVLLGADEARVEAQLHRRQGLRVLAHHPLERVLRHPLRVLRVVGRAVRRGVECVLEVREAMARERRSRTSRRSGTGHRAVTPRPAGRRSPSAAGASGSVRWSSWRAARCRRGCCARRRAPERRAFRARSPRRAPRALHPRRAHRYRRPSTRSLHEVRRARRAAQIS